MSRLAFLIEDGCAVNGLHSMLESGKFSDLTITCGGDRYTVHKAIVCPQSTAFDDVVDSCSPKDNKIPVIPLTGDDPTITRLMIQYFYTGDYEPHFYKYPVEQDRGSFAVYFPKDKTYTYAFPHSCKGQCFTEGAECEYICPHHKCGSVNGNDYCGDDCENFNCETCTTPTPPKGEPSQMLLHSKVYAIADKYDVSMLRKLAAKKFEICCDAWWNRDELWVAAEHAILSVPDSDSSMMDIVIGNIVECRELLDEMGLKMLIA